jgi:hypothetical protein
MVFKFKPMVFKFKPMVAKFCLKVTEINPRTWVNLVTSGILCRIG